MSITIPESPLENRIAQLELENKRLHDTVAYLTRQLYGRSSEKTTALFDGQLSLFDEAEIEAKKKAPEPDGNCQHSCRKSHSEITNVSDSITESFSGFNQT